MANYLTKAYKVGDVFHCDVTVTNPEQNGVVTTELVKFSSLIEKELDDEVTRFIIKIKNNL